MLKLLSKILKIARTKNFSFDLRLDLIVELNSSDGVVFYTDGIPEVFNLENKQYSLYRLGEIISKNSIKRANLL